MNLAKTILSLFLVKGAAGSSPDTDVLITNLLEWLHANGAYINEKVEIRRANKNDPKSPLGLVALADMEADEKICHIPPHLIVFSDSWENDRGDCDTIQATYEIINANEPNPWGRYLLAQTPRYTPEFWSERGRAMLKEMTNDALPPVCIDDTMQDLVETCHGDIENPVYLHAAMLVKSRADYNILTPFYDMTNHHNGKYNMKHLFDPYHVKVGETGYGIATAKAISNGDHLFNSYNRCNICAEYYDWFGTPEMFLSFGFVEQYPQRWLFDLSRIKFDLDIDASGLEVVSWLVPPSKRGVDMLQKELKRLDGFSSKYRAMNIGMPDHEWSLLWDYYDALHNALSHAVESDALLSDDVWNMGHDWWVKDGTVKESNLDYHCVRRSRQEGGDEL